MNTTLALAKGLSGDGLLQISFSQAVLMPSNTRPNMKAHGRAQQHIPRGELDTRKVLYNSFDSIINIILN